MRYQWLYRTPVNCELTLKIFLCKGYVLCPVSGADQQLVNYALHLKVRGSNRAVVVYTAPMQRIDQISFAVE